MTALVTRRKILATAGAAVLLSPLRDARAANYPERPITVIVPYAAGSTGDAVMRLVAEAAEPSLGQRFVIEARPGAGGNVGAQAVASAAPDGHTLLLGATNNFVMNQFLFKKMSFDPLAAFAPITKLADVPSVLYLHPSVPARTIAEFIVHARAYPSKLNYASPSVGTTPHLAVERLKQMAGIDLVHVPFRGSPQAFQALLANDIQLYLAGLSVGRSHVEAGTARALAVASDKRLASMPDVPTVHESGLPGYTAANWWGLAAPRGTPEAVIEVVHRAVVTALQSAAVRERFEQLGLVPGGETAAAFAASLKPEAEAWAATIRQSGLTLD